MRAFAKPLHVNGSRCYFNNVFRGNVCVMEYTETIMRSARLYSSFDTYGNRKVLLSWRLVTSIRAMQWTILASLIPWKYEYMRIFTLHISLDCSQMMSMYSLDWGIRPKEKQKILSCITSSTLHSRMNCVCEKSSPFKKKLQANTSYCPWTMSSSLQIL